MNTFKFFAEIFNAIPLGQVIGEKILVVHGGLFSKDGVTMEEVKCVLFQSILLGVKFFFKKPPRVCFRFAKLIDLDSRAVRV